MSLKQIINERKIIQKNSTSDQGVTIPGEPLLYSIKYAIGTPARSVQMCRNKQWNSLLKCILPAYRKSETPVVIIVRFYVSPPSYVSVSPKDLRNENIPAVRSYELCDYLLSFFEMILHVLFNSYRQIVKIDAEKYYSANPRTFFKFIKWEYYDNSKTDNTVNAKAESISQTRASRLLQHERPGNEPNSPVSSASIKHARNEKARSPAQISASSNSAFPISSTQSNESRSKRKASSVPAHDKARRRQSRKVS